MRNITFIAASLVILCAFNWAIFDKEILRRTGDTVLLELAPVDPRSLMQGDYMRLNYKITADMGWVAHTTGALERGYLVIVPDQDGVGKFVRIDNGKPLGENERLLRYHIDGGRFRLVPDSFMFQEGLRNTYQPAKYGVFKFDKSGNRVLVGLAGTDRKLIEPPPESIPSP
ncbi:MAG: hypothetical protein EPN97_12190 [Alphaproteobacteria bacterium]|nr:MAG: hypothetical protein EPN97_12190 [Alphaproteobacteria bacterium]